MLVRAIISGIVRLALFFHPDSVYLNYRLGRNLAKLGRKSEALVFYKKANCLDPKYMMRHFRHLAPVFTDQGDWVGLTAFSDCAQKMGHHDAWSILLSGSPDKDRFAWCPSKIKPKAITVAIIVYYRLDIDCLASIIELLKTSDDFQPVIYFCPLSNLENDLKIFKVSKNFDVPVQSFSCLQFIADHPRFTFVANPELPPFFYEALNSAGSKFVYIPYGSSISGERFSERLQYASKVHDLAWKIFVISDYHKEQYVKYNKHKKGSNVEVIRTTPKFDAIRRHWRPFEDKQEIRSFLWNIHFSLDSGQTAKRTWSSFHHYYQDIHDYFKANQHLRLIIRPHPLLYTTSYNQDFFECLDVFNDCPNVRIDKSVETGYGNELTADAFITDRSSMIFDFLVLGRPIIILSHNNSAFFNEYAAVLFSEYAYQAKTVEGLKDILINLVSGVDPLTAKRNKLATTDEVFALSRPAAEIIVSILRTECAQDSQSGVSK